MPECLRPCQNSLAAMLARLRNRKDYSRRYLHLIKCEAASPPQDRAVAAWLLQHGTAMYPGWRNPEGLNNRTCFLNTAVMAAFNEDMVYAEGMAATPLSSQVGIWFERHAWNMRKGHVYDITYGSARSAYYYGVVFSREFLNFTMFMTGNNAMGLFHQFDTLWPYLDNYAARDWARIRRE